MKRSAHKVTRKTQMKPIKLLITLIVVLLVSEVGNAQDTPPSKRKEPQNIDATEVVTIALILSFSYGVMKTFRNDR